MTTQTFVKPGEVPDLLQRIELRLMKVKPLQESSLFEVGSERTANKTYTVDLLEGTCTCPSYQWRGVKCKHIRAVESQSREQGDSRNRLILIG